MCSHPRHRCAADLTSPLQFLLERQTPPVGDARRANVKWGAEKENSLKASGDEGNSPTQPHANSPSIDHPYKKMARSFRSNVGLFPPQP